MSVFWQSSVPFFVRMSESTGKNVIKLKVVCRGSSPDDRYDGYDGFFEKSPRARGMGTAKNTIRHIDPFICRICPDDGYDR
jgi:hypothetical protein